MMQSSIIVTCSAELLASLRPLKRQLFSRQLETHIAKLSEQDRTKSANQARTNARQSLASPGATMRQ